MIKELQSKILSSVAPEDFTGRDAELEKLRSLAQHKGSAFLSTGPGFGASEILKKCFDALFRDQSSLTPIYFQVRRTDVTAARCVRRFLYQFLLQTVAFRRRDPRIIKYSPGLDEIVRLSLPGDAGWTEQLAAMVGAPAFQESDYWFEYGFGSAFKLTETIPAFVIFDHLTEAGFLQDGSAMLDSLAGQLNMPGAGFVFSALRRSRHPFSKIKQIAVEPLEHSSVGRLIDSFARVLDIDVTAQTRDLAAAQMGCRPAPVVSLLRAAAKTGAGLGNYKKVQAAYTDEITGGGIARYFDGILNDVSVRPEIQKNVVVILHDLLWTESISRDTWKQRSGLGEDADRGLDILNNREMLSISPGRIEGAFEDNVLADYIEMRYRLEVGGGNRALVIGDALSRSLKRAPALMSSFYRRSSAIGVREILESFDTHDVPAALLDYGKFSSEYKGAPEAEILADLRDAEEKIHLPQIVQTVYTESLYQPISQVSERVRCAVGRGFAGKRYADDEEIVWIAAEIDSKLEASKELAEFWCDRLEMVALVCDFVRFRIWLIAPEGFSPKAVDVLRGRNAIGSSRKQVSLLKQYLSPEESRGHAAEEYEIVVPMGDETELIAAHAVEELAKRHNMDAKSINQIKTALVEACINATEHSHSPDRKIYQKFTFDDKKITIVISNRGIRLTDRRTAADESTESRRGWGLALIRRLMDEVHIEDVEDGTSISMTKYLPKLA